MIGCVANKCKLLTKKPLKGLETEIKPLGECPSTNDREPKKSLSGKNHDRKSFEQKDYQLFLAKRF